MAIEVISASKIKTEPIAFKLNDKESVDLMVQSFDYVPYLYIKKVNDTINSPPIDGTSIDPRDVIYVKLFNSRFLPEIELYCYDSKGILFNDLYPFDHDTLLCIFIKSNSEITMPIRMDFRVTEYETVKPDENKDIFKYLIKGILNVDDLHYTNYNSYRGTSYKILQDLALSMSLGFASNIQSSDDEMTWINPSNTNLEFIKDITKYAYISEDSFIWTFIDFYYNLNYVDVQKEMNEFNRDEKGTITDKKIDKDAEEKVVTQYLTNNRAFTMSNKFISRFNLVNQSFKVNLQKFYKMKGTWYDKNDNTVIKKLLKHLENDDQKLQKDEGTLRQLYDKESTLFVRNLNDEYFIGKIDTQNNVHKNYAFAKLLNKYNLDNLEKMKMIVTLNQINFSIKRFQNIRVDIYNPQDITSSNAGDTNKPSDNINSRLSGFWFVTGINYIYKRSGGAEQEITLMRRDLSIDYGKGNDQKSDLRKLSK